MVNFGVFFKNATFLVIFKHCDEDENTGGKIKLLPKGHQGSGVVGTFRKACVEEGCHLTG